MVKRSPAAGLLVFILLAVLLAPRSAAAVPPQDILIVHSYHQGFPWTDNMMAGMLDVLQKEAPGAQIHAEYLDAKRYPPETFSPLLTETLTRKTSRLRPRVILVSDDAAFDFILSLRSELFPDVPLVFCGVNNFKDERLAGQMEVTGVVEDFDIKSTIDVILTLHRQTTHLAVISDSTETGTINRERFKQVAPVFADRLKFLDLYDLSTEELLGKLAKLPPDTIILNLSFFRDRLGQSYSTQDSNKLIAVHAGRAIYSCWDYFLVGDVVGGYVTSGRQQGEAAASMVAAILKGSRAGDIPILRTSPNAYMFDYKVMERFGIKESALPLGSVVLNHQMSVWEQYWGWLLGFVVIAVLQTFLIVTLLTRGKRLRAANAALEKSEHFARSLLEAIPVPVFHKGGDGRYQGFNQAFLHFYGKSKDELIGKTVFDITSPDFARVYHAKDSELLENSGTQVYPCKVKTGQNDLRDVIFHKASLTDEHGGVIGLIGAILDVTEHKQAEEALRQSEEKFRLLVNTAPFGIQLTDLEGKIVYSNPAHHRIQGYEPNQLIGMYIWDLMADDSHRAKAREYYQTIIGKQPEPTVYFNRDRTKDGREIDVQVNWGYVHNDQGQITGIISILEDITELKRAEDEKRMLTAQLQQAQKMEAIGTLAGGIAHDFNNILGAIVGYAEMIRDDFPSGSPGIHDIDQVLKASHRAKELVKHILTFSRQMEGQKVPIQPAVVVKEAIALLRSSLPTTITINQDIDPDAGIVLADPTQIHQIVMNLCTNAFHAMEAKGGTLTISLGNKILSQDDLATEPHLQPGKFVQLSIRDSGEGISPEIRERIFDPFFTTKEVGKGTGLGLSMVYSIVKSSGGSIHCDSRLGEGTDFRIILPALEGNTVQENGAPEFTLHGKEHILLIDDEEVLAELGKTMLERLGYHVTTRRNSLDALTTFQNQPEAFDLIITDQTMPGMTGIDLARRILQIRPEMPIILCTGYSSLISEDKAKAAGIKGFALKPLAKKYIGELIRKILDGKYP